MNYIVTIWDSGDKYKEAYRFWEYAEALTKYYELLPLWTNVRLEKLTYELLLENHKGVK